MFFLVFPSFCMYIPCVLIFPLLCGVWVVFPDSHLGSCLYADGTGMYVGYVINGLA